VAVASSLELSSRPAVSSPAAVPASSAVGCTAAWLALVLLAFDRPENPAAGGVYLVLSNFACGVLFDARSQGIRLY